MDFWTFIILYLMTVVVFFAIDIVWLGVISKKFYDKHLGSLRSDKVNWTAGLIFYFIFIFGIVFFVIYPAVDAVNIVTAIVSGALFGFVAYATYDLTNLATLKNWPITVTIVDLIWGTFLSASTSTIVYLLFSAFN